MFVHFQIKCDHCAPLKQGLASGVIMVPDSRGAL